MAQTHLNRARHRCDATGIMRNSVQQESGEKRHHGWQYTKKLDAKRR